MSVEAVQKVFKIDGTTPKKDLFFGGSHDTTQILRWNVRDQGAKLLVSGPNSMCVLPYAFSNHPGDKLQRGIRCDECLKTLLGCLACKLMNMRHGGKVLRFRMLQAA